MDHNRSDPPTVTYIRKITNAAVQSVFIGKIRSVVCLVSVSACIGRASFFILCGFLAKKYEPRTEE